MSSQKTDIKSHPKNPISWEVDCLRFMYWYNGQYCLQVDSKIDTTRRNVYKGRDLDDMFQRIKEDKNPLRGCLNDRY